ncbi:MAG TPA: zincin-like metallopeptidase domain-containing protein [Longimicrobium sp.]
MPKHSSQPRDIYQEVTDRIIKALEEEVAPWVRPWNAPDFPRNGGSKRPYNGINVFLLWLTAYERGYRSPDWFTYNQAKALGGQVRRGERGTLVTLWKLLERREAGATPEAEPASGNKTLLLRHFVVFNREQIDGFEAAAEETPRHAWERDLAVETFIRATGARIVEGGTLAGYLPAADEIRMPPLETFVSRERFYSTELHELTHWTGHASRLARDFSGTFGSPAYAREELVAEMGAAFLCAALGVAGQLQHPEYIANWIKVLQEDKKAVFRAASLARQAAEYLGAIPPAGSVEEEEEGEGAAILDAAA